jgi:uncharacterized protein (DUF934 family)
MRKLIKQRMVVDDVWRYPGEVGAAPQVVTLVEFLAATAAGTTPAGGVAVQLEPEDEVEKLAPHLARLSLIVAHFPKDGEGRGFSQAQLLRQRYRYTGELRAAGAIKRDYLFFLARCGFDSFDLHPAEDLVAALATFNTFSAAYQPSFERAGYDRVMAQRARG